MTERRVRSKSRLPIALLARIWTHQISWEDLESYWSNKPWPRNCLPDDDIDAFRRRMSHLAEALESRGGFSKSTSVRALVDPNPKTKEKAAQWLSIELARLRKEEKRIGSAPILSGRLLSRIVIADIAITMLQFLEKPPCENLICLLQELLDVDRHRVALATPRSYSYDRAVVEEAHAELQGMTLGVRKLAKAISVPPRTIPPSTITRWRRLDEYRRDVRDERKQVEEKLAPLVEDILKLNPGMGLEAAYSQAIKTDKRWQSTPGRLSKHFEKELKTKVATTKTIDEVTKLFERNIGHRLSLGEITPSYAGRLSSLFDERIYELKASESTNKGVAHVSA
jgi:hypothetical protein